MYHVIDPQASRDREPRRGAPACRQGTDIMAGQLPGPHIRKASQESAAWCNERAAADLAAAALTDNENIRRRYELSAESWKARAELFRHRDVSGAEAAGMRGSTEKGQPR
jgi:hypothetical protein